MLTVWTGLAALAFGYLLGSVPFGLIFTRMAGLGDVRKIGSGNIGATNVLRTGNKKIAAATLLADLLKGTAAVVVADKFFGRDAALVAGLGSFLGHLYPVWLNFRGGKGVATYIGVMLGLFWPAALVFGIVWAAVAALTRYSSLSALTASAASPVFLFTLNLIPEAALIAALTLVVFLKHHANIGRLLAGTEPRIGSRG